MQLILAGNTAHPDINKFFISQRYNKINGNENR